MFGQRDLKIYPMRLNVWLSVIITNCTIYEGLKSDIPFDSPALIMKYNIFGRIQRGRGRKQPK